MLAEWDAYSTNATTPSWSTEYYFSAEDDGHQVKKGWIYTVPSEEINLEDYNDDELRYMYFNNSGNMIKNQIKKISGKYYAFYKDGIMKTGLVAFDKKGAYVVKFDGDNTQGEELSKLGAYRDKNNGQHFFTKEGSTGFVTFDGGISGKIHYFGTDGARRTGANAIEFADDTYTFSSDNNGHYESIKKKKYYSNGILLKASSDIRYGMYLATGSCTEYDYESLDYNTPITVLNTVGSKVKGSNSSKKDADGNYWLIAKERIDTDEGTIYADELIGIWSQDVRWHSLNIGETTTGTSTKRGLQFKADGWFNSAGSEQNNCWINGDNSILVGLPGNVDTQDDTTGRHVTLSKKGFVDNGSFAILPNKDMALNFTWED